MDQTRAKAEFGFGSRRFQVEITVEGGSLGRRAKDSRERFSRTVPRQESGNESGKAATSRAFGAEAS